jgi:hypothetical protein
MRSFSDTVVLSICLANNVAAVIAAIIAIAQGPPITELKLLKAIAPFIPTEVKEVKTAVASPAPLETAYNAEPNPSKEETIAAVDIKPCAVDTAP